MALNQKQLSAKKAKKTAKAKEKKLVAQKRQLKQQQASLYPKFHFGEYDESVVSADFVSDIKAALSELKFTSNLFTDHDRIFYQIMKESGYQSALDTVYQACVNTGRIVEPDGTVNQAELNKLNACYATQLGSIIYNQLNEKGLLAKYLPINDCSIKPLKRVEITESRVTTWDDFKLEFKALHAERVLGGMAYYSWNKPQIEGRKYTVAFSKHALERVAQRCAADPLSYAGSGDAFAFLGQCIYYEPCILDNDGEQILGFTFYDSCSPGFISWSYVENVLETSSHEEKYYYRVGYCPVDLSGDFAKARTLLTPGMKGTPEEALIRGISDSRQRALMQRSTQNLTSRKRQGGSNDYEAAKFFHREGIPQVIVSDKRYFKYD